MGRLDIVDAVTITPWAAVLAGIPALDQNAARTTYRVQGESIVAYWDFERARRNGMPAIDGSGSGFSVTFWPVADGYFRTKERFGPTPVEVTPTALGGKWVSMSGSWTGDFSALRRGEPVWTRDVGFDRFEIMYPVESYLASQGWQRQVSWLGRLINAWSKPTESRAMR